MENEENLSDLALQKIAYGDYLLEEVDKFKNIEGIQKLRRKITQELSFLNKICRDENIKKEHLRCSNLTHFGALIVTLNSIDVCLSLNKVFNLEDRKIVVDIVYDDGLSWIKVIARNPKSISQICKGDTGYGVRSVLDQAEEYLKCANLYPCKFQTPKITFVFSNGITIGLATQLESMGIVVNGTRIENFELEGDEVDFKHNSELSTRFTSHISKANLDVSTMLAYVSSFTNGNNKKYKYTTDILNQQAEWEAARPVKPLLDAFFKDKKLYCCTTARDSFIGIVNTVGGPTEKLRAEEFLKRIIVLPDDATAEDSENDKMVHNVQFTSNKVLPIGGKIKERSLTIFRFGDRIRAVTATSNDGFVRAAKQKGIDFVVYVHESRALTELKETKAVIIDC